MLKDSKKESEVVDRWSGDEENFVGRKQSLRDAEKKVEDKKQCLEDLRELLKMTKGTFEETKLTGFRKDYQTWPLQDLGKNFKAMKNYYLWGTRKNFDADKWQDLWDSWENQTMA